VRHAEVLGERGLERLDPGPHGQPPRVQAVGDRLDVALPQADVEDRDLAQAFA
jgi:hypothetical protein